MRHQHEGRTDVLRPVGLAKAVVIGLLLVQADRRCEITDPARRAEAQVHHGGRVIQFRLQLDQQGLKLTNRTGGKERE